jgi:hypothetical protein
MYSRIVIVLLFSCLVPSVFASPANVLREMDAFPHVARVSHDVKEVIDYEIGLGAMRKVRGAWSFKESERQSGELTRYTWQIIDGFTASEVLEKLEEKLVDSRLLFSCEGRDCGRGVQWANRVFRERLLYGKDDLQRYRVYGADATSNQDFRVLLFSASRTADRQYLHAEFLAIEDQRPAQ